MDIEAPILSSEENTSSSEECLNIECVNLNAGYSYSSKNLCECDSRKFTSSFVRGIIGRKLEMYCLVDTGSCHTLFNIDAWKIICKNDKISRTIHQSKLSFKASNARRLKCVGCCDLRIQIGNVSIIHRVYVIDCATHSLILGCDIINRLEASIDYHQQKIHFYGTSVALTGAFIHSKPHCRTKQIKKYQI